MLFIFQLSSTARAVCWQGEWIVVGITYARFKMPARKSLKQGYVWFYFQGIHCILCIMIWECLANTELSGPLSTSTLYFFKLENMFIFGHGMHFGETLLSNFPPTAQSASAQQLCGFPLSSELLSCVERERDIWKAFTSFSLQDLIWNLDTLPDYVFLLQNLEF